MKIEKISVIAEAGVNHNGKVKIAKKLVDAAKNAGADYIKFQAYKTNQLVTDRTKLANYQKSFSKNNKTQSDMLKKYELKKKDFEELIEYCKSKKIKFLASVFDITSFNMLVELRMPIFKIPSGEIINLPLLELIGRLNKKIILSTGMSNMNDIKKALKILMQSGTNIKNIIVLHCNSEYPTPIRDINLRAMHTIKKNFKVDIGYSDHSYDIEVPIIAAALGAKIIEKHITLNRRMQGPDHKSSLTPKEFSKMVKNIRKTEIILGSNKKYPSQSEIKNIKHVRQSIVSSKFIYKGEKFTKFNLTTKRFGKGISPMEIKKIFGTISKRNYEKNELIKK